VNQKEKSIFKLRGNRDREELPHCAVLTMPVEELSHCSTALWLQSSGSNEGENMDAPLLDCTIEEQRGVVGFSLGRRSETCGNSPSYVGSVWTEHHESTKGL